MTISKKELEAKVVDLRTHFDKFLEHNPPPAGKRWMVLGDNKLHLVHKTPCDCQGEECET